MYHFVKRKVNFKKKLESWENISWKTIWEYIIPFRESPMIRDVPTGATEPQCGAFPRV